LGKTGPLWQSRRGEQKRQKLRASLQNGTKVRRTNGSPPQSRNREKGINKEARDCGKVWQAPKSQGEKKRVLGGGDLKVLKPAANRTVKGEKEELQDSSRSGGKGTFYPPCSKPPGVKVGFAMSQAKCGLWGPCPEGKIKTNALTIPPGGKALRKKGNFKENCDVQSVGVGSEERTQARVAQGGKLEKANCMEGSKTWHPPSAKDPARKAKIRVMKTDAKKAVSRQKFKKVRSGGGNLADIYRSQWGWPRRGWGPWAFLKKKESWERREREKKDLKKVARNRKRALKKKKIHNPSVPRMTTGRREDDCAWVRRVRGKGDRVMG